VPTAFFQVLQVSDSEAETEAEKADVAQTEAMSAAKL